MGRRAEPPLVGRKEEQRLISAALGASAAGSGRSLVLRGEAGAGKTRLLAWAIQEAWQRGFKVLNTSCEEAERERPFAPLLRCLGLDVASLPQHPDEEVRSERRFLMMDKILDGFEMRSVHAPVLVTIDDLHWADPSTIDTLHSHLFRGGQHRMMFLGASRSATHERLTRLWRMLENAGAIRDLTGLSEEEARALASTIVNNDPGRHSQEILDRCGGNPLLIIEALRSMSSGAATRHRAGSDIQSSSPLGAIRQLLPDLLGTLAPSAIDMLRFASAFGNAFSVRGLSLAMGRPLAELLPDVSSALDAALLADQEGLLSFRHDLLREAIYASIPLSVRTAMHREIADTLSEGGGSPIEVAHHLRLGAQAGDCEAVRSLVAAAEEIQNISSELAVEVLEKASELEIGLARKQVIDLKRLAALARAGHAERAIELAEQMLRIGSISGDLLLSLGQMLFLRGRPHEATRYFGLALEQPVDSELAVQLHCYLGLAHVFAWRMDEAARNREALAALSDPLAVPFGRLLDCAWAEYEGRDEDMVSAGTDTLRQLPLRFEGTLAWVGGIWGLSRGLIAVDRLTEAADLLARSIGRSEAHGDVWHLSMFHGTRSRALLHLGRWDEAEAEAEAAVTTSEEHGATVGVAAALFTLVTIACGRGDVASANRFLESARSHTGDLETWGSDALALSLALCAELEGSRDAFETAIQQWAEIPVRSSVVAVVHCDLVRIAIALGAREAVPDLLRTVDSIAERSSSTSLRASVAYCHGVWSRDVPLLEESCSLAVAAGRPVLQAMISEALTEVLSESNVKRAVTLFQEASEIYEQIGATFHSERVAKSLAARAIEGGRRRPRLGWGSLTRSELQIACLVSAGMSNPQIGQELYVSRRTVQAHLSHIFAKLGITSRVELAVMFREHEGPPADI